MFRMNFVEAIRAALERAERGIGARQVEPWLAAEIEKLKSADAPIEITAEALQRFLASTTDAGPPRSERLRRLAIELEDEDFVDGWAGFRRIYEAAASESPNDAWVFLSWGISADHSWLWRSKLEEERLQIWEAADRALARAVELSPDDADILYAMGHLRYQHPTDDTDSGEHAVRAIPWLVRAIEVNPHHPMAQLFRAHCYHDQKKWQAAVRAYEAVEASRLLEERPCEAGRVVKLRAQLAFCLAQSGDPAEAGRQLLLLVNDVDQFTRDELRELVGSMLSFSEILEDTANRVKSPHLLEATRATILRVERRWDDEEG
ncbi:tetratricopeptide repeat protein [Sorangium cellulosum]|uniref:tetratricopeptide repeat protein n=1 Tax=Sorangium cellulosum TaxID=56 RepID=UPI0005D1CBD9|nr:hypothetical protein [Sorangium cellulosum]